MVDENQQSLSYVNAVLFNLPDSTYLLGTTSGQDGRFELPAENGRTYILQLTFVGFATESIGFVQPVMQ